MKLKYPLFTTHQPYCIQRIKKDHWILLNRNYKPLGMITQQHIQYQDYPEMIFQLKEQTLCNILQTQPNEKGTIYLYENSKTLLKDAHAMDRYNQKLQQLYPQIIEAAPTAPN